MIETQSYDAHGKRRNSDWSDINGNAPASITTDRGFTGHEHIDEVGLVHMNGRVYDSTLGRFISADPSIQAPYNSQSFNRYSYVLNNPLSYTDPSGFSFLSKAFKKFRHAVNKIFRGIKNFWQSVLKNEILRTALSIAVLFISGGQGLAVAMMKGFAAGFIGSGGDLKAGVIGALSAGAVNYIGHGSLSPWKGLGKAFSATKSLAHGVVGGLASVANGGKFKSGFLAGGFSAATEPLAEFAAPQLTGAINPTQVAIAATVGGAGSVLGGGKFANGAITGAFVNVFNAQWKDEFGQTVIDTEADLSKEEALKQSKKYGHLEQLIGRDRPNDYNTQQGIDNANLLVDSSLLAVGSFAGAPLALGASVVSTIRAYSSNSEIGLFSAALGSVKIFRAETLFGHLSGMASESSGVYDIVETYNK